MQTIFEKKIFLRNTKFLIDFNFLLTETEHRHFITYEAYFVRFQFILAITESVIDMLTKFHCSRCAQSDPMNMWQ